MKAPKFPASDTEKLRLEKLKGLILSDEDLANHPFYEAENSRFYVVELSAGEKRLVFFGSPHINDPEDSVFEEIRRKFEELDPEIIYVEGMRNINLDKNNIVEKFKKEDLKTGMKRSESHFTLKLAVDMGVDFESPELSRAQENEYLLSQGFSKRDIFTHHMYAIISQYQRSCKDRTLESCKKYLTPYIKHFHESSGWDKKDLTTWEEEIFEKLDLEDEIFYQSKIDPIPWEGKPQTVFNEISRSSGKPRDAYIFERIVEGLKKYDRVFVVYGSAHALRQEPAFRALFENLNQHI